MRKVVVAVALLPGLLALLLAVESHQSVATTLLDASGAALGFGLVLALVLRPAMRPTHPVVLGGLVVLWAIAVLGVTVFREPVSGWLVASNWLAVVLTGVVTSRVGGPPAPASEAAAATAFGLLALALPWAMLPGPDVWTFAMLVTLATVVAVAAGLQARGARARVAAAQQAARERVRHEMAGELHDVIAHEVTGIVVLAQAAGSMASGPDAQVFASIEAAGARALAEIRTLVSTLRDPDDPAAREPAPDAATLHEVVAGFASTTDAEVVDAIQDAALADLPAPVLVAAHRVLAEALTNVRRHAAGASRVVATIDREGGRLRVRVENDRAVAGGGVGPGNSSGLAGLAERCRLLGGEFEAAPVPGGGWAVTARLPVAAQARTGVVR